MYLQKLSLEMGFPIEELDLILLNLIKKSKSFDEDLRSFVGEENYEIALKAVDEICDRYGLKKPEKSRFVVETFKNYYDLHLPSTITEA